MKEAAGKRPKQTRKDENRNVAFNPPLSEQIKNTRHIF